MNVLPYDIANDMKSCALSAGKSTSYERKGKKGEAGAKKIEWNDFADSFKRKSSGLLCAQTCKDIKLMFWYASWHTANTRKGYKGDATRDKATVEEKYRDIVQRGEMKESLASNIKEMGWYIAWYCANEAWGYTGDSARDKATYESHFRKIHGEIYVKRMTFFHDRAKILQQKPAIVQQETLNNKTNTEQSMSFTFSTTEGKTDSVSHQVGFKFGIKSTFDVNFPVAGSKVELSFETSSTDTNTLTVSKSKTKTYSFPIKVPPQSTCVAKGMVHECEAEVPFELEFDFGNDIIKKFQGVWKGVAVSEATFEVNQK